MVRLWAFHFIDTLEACKLVSHQKREKHLWGPTLTLFDNLNCSGAVEPEFRFIDTTTCDRQKREREMFVNQTVNISPRDASDLRLLRSSRFNPSYLLFSSIVRSSPRCIMASISSLIESLDREKLSKWL